VLVAERFEQVDDAVEGFGVLDYAFDIDQYFTHQRAHPFLHLQHKYRDF
jgi:hypothetical protein